jgi:Tol biopolymer transport system component
MDRGPVWTPDGRRIVFASNRAKAGVTNLYWVNADGTGDVTRLTDSPESQTPWSWHPSGKFLAFYSNRGATGNDLMILSIEGDAARGWTPGKPTVFLSTPANETAPMFSPDGRWIAYHSNEPRQLRCVRASVPRVRRKMARFHGGRRLSPVVDHHARSVVPDREWEGDGCAVRRCGRFVPRRHTADLVADERSEWEQH